MKKWFSLAALCFFFSASQFAYAFDLLWPTTCKIWHDCFLFQHSTNYFIAPTLQEITANPHHRQTDNGLDIALPTYEKRERQFFIVAAASGTVIRVRDQEVDHFRTEFEHSPGKECGNGVVISHADGWETQYCHLQAHSIVVRPGQHITAGQIIGKLGSSGQALFPMLHFSVRHEGEPVDPFAQSLWRDKSIAYRDLGLIDMGMYDTPVDLLSLLKKPLKKSVFSRKDRAMIVWVRVFSVKKGDVQRFVFYSPDGSIYRRPIEDKLNASHGEWFAFAGYVLRGKHIPKAYDGEWRVVYSIKRDEGAWQEVGETRFTLKN